MNSITINGRLGRDPETVKTSNSQVSKFSLASRERNETLWVDVECWGKLSEIASKHLKKGSSIVVKGRLSEDRWTDKGGNNRSRMKIVADEIEFTGSKESSEETIEVPRSEIGESDLPF